MDVAAPLPEEKPLPWKYFCGLWEIPVKGAGLCRPVGPNLVAREACAFVDVSVFDRMTEAQLRGCTNFVVPSASFFVFANLMAMAPSSLLTCLKPMVVTFIERAPKFQSAVKKARAKA